ncbi:uncharacterized protein LOC109862191 isoform X2 [Pseudomyrmex gracilis]|uniref:uncharacterized protein LOC109851755 isoform X2 n=1 Tax=Pseudomyrmex gracilis TaxID=219809 RepID=UPI00099583C5|nr:uncharacterized protein LOC109851755 isoform X2 [Pseudomyrmex gracilis]XP_020297754.1 uncharacterized protein LOC109862191 isoform X2 [Pseudomyrmex gracilis]
MDTSNCSLEVNKEQELIVLIEKCDKSVQSPQPEKSSKSYDCKYCKTNFMTAEELVKHGDKCDIQFRISMNTELKHVSKLVAEIKNRIVPKPNSMGECYYCRQKLYSVEEAFGHRKKCKVYLTGKIVEQMYRNFKQMLGEDWPPRITLPSPPKESKEKEHQEQQKSLRKRVLDTDTEKDRATTSTFTPETSPPPSKICRSNDKDITDIETKQITTTDRKICDDKKNECEKGSFECVFCTRKFPSADALKLHIMECCKTYNV